VFGTRGEILTVPAGGGGQFHNVTQTSNAVERDPSWSPDGGSIAYFSDESGEYELHVRDVNGTGEVRKIGLGDPPAFYYSPTWSPDSRKIGYLDQRLSYWYVDLDKRMPVHFDTDLYVDPKQGMQMAWSADSRYLAYTKQLPSHLHALFLYSLEQSKTIQLTDGQSDILYASFDKSGRYLYFTSSTDVALASGWMDSSSLQRPVTRSVYAILLNKTVASPLAVEDEYAKVRQKEKQGPDIGTAQWGSAPAIDLEGIQQRRVALPITPANYYALLAGEPGVLYLVAGPLVDPLWSYSGGLGGIATTVQKFDLSTRKTTPFLGEATAFHPFSKYESSVRLSSRGNRILYASQGEWFTAPTDRPVTAATRQQIRLEDLQIQIDPRAEWRHMFDQVWRGERDFFYDPNLHGLDLAAVKKKYQPYLDHLTTRQDLNYLFREMLSEVTVGHMDASGGDLQPPKGANTGLLGADYSVEHGRYRFSQIYRGDTWNPETHAPLAQPGSEVQPGEYLLKVDGRDVHPTADVYSFFQQMAGKPVKLTVGPKADGSQARELTVMPIRDETSLRNFAWVEANRRKVDAMTSGQVGYVYVPDTSAQGYRAFNRDFFAQVGKSAVIIDERYNVGGVGSDYFVDLLRRPLMNAWHTRYGQDFTSPQESVFGPKVMLINSLSGSGGDLFAWTFRQAGVGLLMGKRTWGGLVGAYAIPGDLLDGGLVWTPDLAFYNPNGSWDIENHGVAPDIEVDEDPQAQRGGHNVQLEKAISVVLELLRTNPPPKAPHHPPFPNYQLSGH